MSSEKTISDLRAALFAAIDGVTQGTLDLDRAKMVSDLAQVVVNTAKVEVDYLKANSGGESPFIEAIGNDALPPGVTRHRLK